MTERFDEMAYAVLGLGQDATLVDFDPSRAMLEGAESRRYSR